ncbi:unnamed protein product [Mytilus edulis]|uniref:Chromo domain-containing protein n=1 Tax=Mytilus edulis TaxID=6550 RepID=A0A8S3QJL8_MYTED|nr:unnamed protein product [Mytilus edulis]
MLKYNIIEPSQSEWASPICLVQKKSPKSASSTPNTPQYRFCVDFRLLNTLTTKKVHPIVQMDDIVDMLGEAKAKFYSTVDMFNGFHQIKLDPETKHKTAFTCHEGVFEFNRLPFGLSNSPHTFQLVMSEALREHLKSICNTLRLYSKSMETNLKLKPTKCTFAAKEVKFLGHVLSKDGIAVDTTKTDAIKTFPIPQNITDVRAFLGLANYYRKFVKGFSKIASPLHRLLVKDDVPIKGPVNANRLKQYHDPQDRPTNNVDVPTDDEMSDDEDEEENTQDADEIVQNDIQPENEVQRNNDDNRTNDDPDMYQVERIIHAKRINKKMHYKIKWLGYSHRHNTYEPEENIPQELRHDFKVRKDQTDV